jgi:hypothetical protein
MRRPAAKNYSLSFAPIESLDYTDITLLVGSSSTIFTSLKESSQIPKLEVHHSIKINQERYEVPNLNQFMFRRFDDMNIQNSLGDSPFEFVENPVTKFVDLRLKNNQKTIITCHMIFSNIFRKMKEWLFNCFCYAVGNVIFQVPLNFNESQKKEVIQCFKKCEIQKVILVDTNSILAASLLIKDRIEREKVLVVNWSEDSFEISIMKIDKNSIEVLDKVVETEFALSKIRKSISRVLANKLFHNDSKIDDNHIQPCEIDELYPYSLKALQDCYLSNKSTIIFSNEEKDQNIVEISKDEINNRCHYFFKKFQSIVRMVISKSNLINSIVLSGQFFFQPEIKNHFQKDFELTNSIFREPIEKLGCTLWLSKTVILREKSDSSLETQELQTHKNCRLTSFDPICVFQDEGSEDEQFHQEKLGIEDDY